jgi:hypothetical protein
LTDEIAAMLDTDPKVPATVVLQHLRLSGYAGGITILKDYLTKVRPSFLPCGSDIPAHELPARRYLSLRSTGGVPDGRSGPQGRDPAAVVPVGGPSSDRSSVTRAIYH